MELLHPAAEAYVSRYSTAEDPLLAQIAREAAAAHAQPHMLSGHVQGRFLELISQLLQPRRGLENGTMVGPGYRPYARGMATDGKLYTIEKRPGDAIQARHNFERAGLQHRIELLEGDALELLPQLEETWDLVFLDADKVNYAAYYRLVIPRLRKGGLLLADNVLFHGQVLETPLKGKNAQAIQSFNDLVAADPEVEKVMLTLRDGLFLIRKK